MTTISELTELLSFPGLRIRTGLWLYPMDLLGEEENEAVRLGVIAKDARVALLASTPQSSNFLGLDPRRLLQLLDDIIYQEQDGSVLLIYNFDLPLARLPLSQRESVWQEAFLSFPYRPKGIILPIPEQADHLLPSDSLMEQWRMAGRLAEST